MRQTPRKLCLSLAFCTGTTLAAAQTSPPAVGPGGGTALRPPPPPDTTLTRQQADQGRDAMIAPLKISYGKKSAEWTAPKLAAASPRNHSGHQCSVLRRRKPTLAYR